MTHIDRNSIKHFSVCFILSLIGAYGMSVAIGASVIIARPKTITGVGGYSI